MHGSSRITHDRGRDNDLRASLASPPPLAWQRVWRRSAPQDRCLVWCLDHNETRAHAPRAVRPDETILQTAFHNRATRHNPAALLSFSTPRRTLVDHFPDPCPEPRPVPRSCGGEALRRGQLVSRSQLRSIGPDGGEPQRKWVAWRLALAVVAASSSRSHTRWPVVSASGVAGAAEDGTAAHFLRARAS